MSGYAHIGNGSSTDLTAPKFDFRSSPESGLKWDIGPCPVRATTGLMSRQKTRLFDQLFGAAQQREWHGEPERFGGLKIDNQFEICGLLHRQFGRQLAP